MSQYKCLTISTSNDPWRASIVISDATNLKNLGYNVTLLLSIEGVQVGVKTLTIF